MEDRQPRLTPLIGRESVRFPGFFRNTRIIGVDRQAGRRLNGRTIERRLQSGRRINNWPPFQSADDNLVRTVMSGPAGDQGKRR
ncbi:MAG: hypothetical protein JWN34_1377 [Bryobacterales bacterium]|jgi:hypothetical protein|nr:hypothetical protein [Bryobacterales bacterium]